MVIAPYKGRNLKVSIDRSHNGGAKVNLDRSIGIVTLNYNCSENEPGVRRPRASRNSPKLSVDSWSGL